MVDLFSYWCPHKHENIALEWIHFINIQYQYNFVENDV